MAQDSNVQSSFAATLYIAGGTSSWPTTVSGIAGIGTAAQPSWVVYNGVQNMTLNLAKGESDVSIRGVNGFKLTKGAIKELSVEFNVPYVRGDAKRESLYNAFMSGVQVGCAFLDGLISDAGSKGFALDMEIVAATLDEQIAGTIEQKFTMKPCYPSADTAGTLTAPSLVHGSTGGSLVLTAAF